MGIIDDLIIWGVKTGGSSHDKCLTEILEVTRQHHLKLNVDKLQFKTKQARFLGSILQVIVTSQKMKKCKPSIKCHSEQMQKTFYFREWLVI